VTGENRNGSIAAAGAGHFSGGLALCFESFEDLVSSSHAADISGADARGLESAGSAGEVVVEGDGAVKVGEGSL
jgi:hypothetical protein